MKYFQTAFTLSALLWTALFAFRIPPDSSAIERFRRNALSQSELPTGTCNAQTPCVNSACCGTNGLCGYSPTECGAAIAHPIVMQKQSVANMACQGNGIAH